MSWRCVFEFLSFFFFLSLSFKTEAGESKWILFEQSLFANGLFSCFYIMINWHILVFTDLGIFNWIQLVEICLLQPPEMILLMIFFDSFSSFAIFESTSKRFSITFYVFITVAKAKSVTINWYDSICQNLFSFCLPFFLKLNMHQPLWTR